MLFDYKPTSKNAIPLKRGEYIVVMPVRTDTSNSRSGGSTGDNPNVAMWIAGSKITGETGYFPSSFVELIKLEGASPKKRINTNSPTLKAKATPNKKVSKFTPKKAETINTPKKIRSAKKSIKIHRKRSSEIKSLKIDVKRKGPRSNKKKQRAVTINQTSKPRAPVAKSTPSVTGNGEKNMEFRGNKTGNMSSNNEEDEEIETPLNTVSSSDFDGVKSNLHSSAARTLMENHVVAWLKQCVEISIYAIDRTYLNLALQACKKYNLTDISEEECLEKLEAEDELNYILTRSFFKNCQDPCATVDKIKSAVEKENSVSQAAFNFMSKRSFRAQKAQQFLEIFGGNDDLSNMKLLCECASFINTTCNDPGGRSNENLQKRKLLYHILQNGEYGDEILGNKQFMPHLISVQKLCRMISPCALLFVYKTLRGEQDHDTDEMQSIFDFLIPSYLGFSTMQSTVA